MLFAASYGRAATSELLLHAKPQRIITEPMMMSHNLEDIL
jgi:hypothetical protein